MEMIGWRNRIKDGLAALFILSITTLPPAVVLLWRENIRVGLSLLLGALVLGSISFGVAAYWHARDIHVTVIGSWILTAGFVAGPFVVGILGFTPWFNAAVSACFLAKPAYLALRDLKKRSMVFSKTNARRISECAPLMTWQCQCSSPNCTIRINLSQKDREKALRNKYFVVSAICEGSVLPGDTLTEDCGSYKIYKAPPDD